MFFFLVFLQNRNQWGQFSLSSLSLSVSLFSLFSVSLLFLAILLQNISMERSKNENLKEKVFIKEIPFCRATTPHDTLSFRLPPQPPPLRRRDSSRGGGRIHQSHQILHRHLARVLPHGIGPFLLHLLPRERGADS